MANFWSCPLFYGTPSRRQRKQLECENDDDCRRKEYCAQEEPEKGMCLVQKNLELNERCDRNGGIFDTGQFFNYVMVFLTFY